MSNRKKKSNNKKGKKIIIIAFIILLIALVACIVLLLHKPDDKIERNFVDRDNAEKIVDDMAEKVEEGMFECMMSTTWNFDDGNSVSPNAYVANVENNQHTICFDVYETETEELLYSSPFLPVGTDINNIKLDKNLSAGEYDAVVRYTLVDENDEEISTVDFTITISVAH